MGEPRKKALTADERRRLLDELAGWPSDADVDLTDSLRIFLPLPQHAQALRDRIMVVRGERGAGKTALFNFIDALDREGIAREKVFGGSGRGAETWIDGFSETGTEHPSVLVLDAFGHKASDEQLRVFWMAHLVGRLSRRLDVAVPEPVGEFLETWTERINDPGHWTGVAQDELPALTSFADSVERRLAELGRTVVVAYDYLDKIGSQETPGAQATRVRERFASTLLALWLSLSNRYRHLRAKVFIREDLFSASRRASADASKLLSRSVSLQWDTQALYRMLIRRVANGSDELREWLVTGHNRIPVEEDRRLGWMPPENLPEEGRVSQKAFVEHLAGKQMGKGVKKGYVYRWIPNRLQDAHGAIVPRSLVNLVRCAAEFAVRTGPRAGFARLLHPLELQAGLEQTSKARVGELREEHPVIGRFENLRGITVMADRAEVEELLANPPAESSGDDGYGHDGEGVLNDLVGLGVLKVRDDGRIDVPDLYRYGYGIRRKGGVARPR